VGVRILEQLVGIGTLQHVEGDGTAWGTHNRRILRRSSGAWRVLGEFPPTYPRDLLGWTRLGTRAARADQSNVYVNRSGTAIAIRSGVVYRLSPSPFSLDRIGQLKGDCALHGGFCEDPDGFVFFGEYFRNRERESVRVWRVRPDGRGMDVAHEFPAGSIRHVHGVFRDSFQKDTYWVATGDYAGECYLFATDASFGRLERVGEGTQRWRAVTLYFTDEYVCWITDSHIEQNYACRWRRRDGAFETGAKVDCSAWHGTTTIDGLYVACTAVEKGPGIMSDRASLLVSRDGFVWREATSFKKDRWRPYAAFKAGVISCATGANDSQSLYLSGQALSGFDGITLRVAIDA